MMIIGAGISAIGAMSSASAQSAQASAQAAAQEREADNRLRANAYKQERDGEKSAALRSEQMNAMAGGGFGINGSNLDVLTESAKQNTLDIRANTWSAETQADGLRFQAENNRRAAKNAQTAGMFNVASSLISPFSSKNSVFMGGGSNNAFSGFKWGGGYNRDLSATGN
jgi:hypothetical protein